MPAIMLSLFLLLFSVLVCTSNSVLAETSLTNANNPNNTGIDNSAITNEKVELILQIKVNRLILGDVFGIQRDKTIYIGMQNLFEVLGFLIHVDMKEKTADGWFIKDDLTFNMEEPNNSSGSVEIDANNSTYMINKDSFIYEDDDIYIDAKAIFNIFEIEYKIETNNMLLRIFPTTPLPIQEKLRRQARKKARNRNLAAKLPLKRTPYKLWTTPFIDAQTRYTTNSAKNDTLSYSILGAGDLAYMTSTYYVQGDRDDQLKFFRMKLSRDSLSNKLLGPLKATHFSFGDINPNIGGGVGQAGNEVGVRISNRPYGRILRQQKTDFYGDAQPGWDVELYRNNIYLGIQSVEENGRYEFFNQDILAGKNIFKLVFYGPQGQRYEKTEEINLNQSGLDVRKVLYDVSLSHQHSRLFEFRDDFSSREEETRRFNLNLIKDVNEYVSFKGTYSRYTFSDGTTHNFIKPSTRIMFFDTLLFADFILDLNGGASTYYSLSRSFWQQALTYSNSISTADFVTESTDAIKTHQTVQNVDLSGPLLTTRFLRANYGVSASRSISKDVSVVDKYTANFSANILRFSISNNVNYTKTKAIDSPVVHAVNGIASLSKSMFGVNFRGGTSYLLEPSKDIKLKQITRLTGNISWRPFPRIRSQYTYSYVPISKNTSHAISLNWRTKKFSVISNFTRRNNGAYTAHMGINFSVGYDNKTSSFSLGSERIARTGGVSARVYRDDNFNGRLDATDPVIEGAKILAEQAKRHGKSNDAGIVFFPGLPTDRRTDVALDVSSLEDPFLIQIDNGYSFVPRPGVVETFNVPLVTSGEVEGVVYIENANGTKQPAGGIPITLTNIKTRDLESVVSAYDGFYLFSSIKPGRYLVSIDQTYLKRFKYSARKPMPRVVDIYRNGNVNMGNDFRIFAEN